MKWLKPIARKLPFYGALQDLQRAWVHRILHNDNQLFYTLSPDLLVAIVKAFNIQKERGKLLEGHAYYEFGVFRGFSLWFAEKLSREYAESFRLYGFDSFEGLPASQVDRDPIHWAEGNYAASLDFVSTQLKAHGSDFSRISLHKGYFSKDLFDRIQRGEKLLPASICVVDSDIYESCAAVLDFIKDHLVVGSLLLFDDYNVFEKDPRRGERRALDEFERKNPGFRKEHLFHFGQLGEAFKVTGL